MARRSFMDRMCNEENVRKDLEMTLPSCEEAIEKLEITGPSWADIMEGEEMKENAKTVAENVKRLRQQRKRAMNSSPLSGTSLKQQNLSKDPSVLLNNTGLSGRIIENELQFQARRTTLEVAQFQSNRKEKDPISFALAVKQEFNRHLPDTDDDSNNSSRTPSRREWKNERKFSVNKIEKSPLTLYECDPETLKRRQKQIDQGKNTLGYQYYLEHYPKNLRSSDDPRTPRKQLIYSRRSWDAQIKIWRKQLHKYDAFIDNNDSMEIGSDMSGDLESEGSVGFPSPTTPLSSARKHLNMS